MAGHICWNPELNFADWSSGKLKAPSTLQDQVLRYLCKREVGFDKQLWLITSQFTATGGWGFHSSLLPHFPAPLTFPTPSFHGLWHSLGFQLTHLTEKDLLCCCCCRCIGFSARSGSSGSSWKRRQHLQMHLHKDRTSSGQATKGHKMGGIKLKKKEEDKVFPFHQIWAFKISSIHSP